MTETAAANNPNEASASSQASATQSAAADGGTGEQQQTQPGQTQAAAAVEPPAEGKQEAVSTEGAVVPEKYEFKAPEGTEYDPQILEAFTGAAKEAALTQDAAQKLIEKMAPALAARQADQVKAIHQEWLDASSADKEFGGQKLTENLGVARKALDNFGTPELRTLLEQTGLGNHPEVLRFMYRAGKAISEDKFVGGSSAGVGRVNPANVLYDNTKTA